MARLTSSDRERLRAQLLAALAPSQAEAIAKLADAAAAAVMTEYYSAKTLKLFSGMPEEYWGRGISYLTVEPTGRGARGLAPRRTFAAPIAPEPKQFRPSAATQASIDTWSAAVDAAEKTRRDTTYQIDSVLARATTLESLLALLPAARGILKLPAAEPATDTAAKLNAALAAQQRPPASKPPAAKPAASKPARKRTA
jgi:hypothetical protein